MSDRTSGNWIVNRSRVRLAGLVTAAGGGIASGGRLTLSGSQGNDQGKANSPPPAFQRRYDACIRDDGFYFFVDLPAGDYLLSGKDESGNEIEQQQVVVPPIAELGASVFVALDLRAKVDSGTEQRKVPDIKEAPAAPVRRRRGSRGAVTGGTNM